MKGRHAASGWSPFWRDILLRSLLVLLLVAMVVFIWWLFSEDDLFTGAVSTTTDPAGATSTQVPSTAAPTSVTTSAASTVSTATPDTTVAESVTTTAPPSTSTTTTIPPPLSPDELVVRVYNANGVGGVAGRTTARLEEAGYGVANPDNHSQFLDISRVWYREGLEREAQQLRDSLILDALVEPAPQERDGIDLLVILGRSFEE